MRMRRKKWMDEELKDSRFFLEPAAEHLGAWQKTFAKQQPMWLELGVGKGGFIAALGVLHPEVNLLGIDITTAVLASAHRAVKEAYGGKPVDNLRLTVWDVGRLPEIMNEQDAVQRIYINFCNPWPKERHKKRRLTHPKQLALYKNVLVPGGELRFKTDDDGLFTDTLAWLAKDPEWHITECTDDLEKRPDIESPLTEHQILFTGRGIPTKYVAARYDPQEKS